MLRSPLFIINWKYYYQFPYGADPSTFMPFINEYFKPGIIKSILVYLDDGKLFGHASEDNNAIVIRLKEKVKFNPEVSGLKIISRKKNRVFNNFKDYF